MWKAVANMDESKKPTFSRITPVKSWAGSLLGPANRHMGMDVIFPVLVGLLVASLILVGLRVSVQTAILAILVLVALVVVILVKDIPRLLLVTLVVDIPLGLDIGLGTRYDHNGGPAGFIISLMTLGLLVGYLVWVAQKPQGAGSRRLLHADVSIRAALFMFAMLLSTFRSTEIWFSLTQFFLEVQFLLMYLYVIQHVREWGHVRLVFTTLAIALLVESLIILSQYFTGFEFSLMGIQIGGAGAGAARFSGTLGHPNNAATFLAAGLMIIFGASLARKPLIDRKLAITAFILGTVALVPTESRAVWIIYAVLVPLVALFSRKGQVSAKAIMLMGIVALLIIFGFSTQIIDRFTTDDRGSAESRIWQAQLAFNILREHPIAGIGLNNLWEVAPDHLPLEMLENRNVIHNKYLTVWTETGILGLFAFIWLLLAALRRAWSTFRSTRDPDIATTIAGLLAALMVFILHMFVATFNERPRLQFIWLALALIVSVTGLVRSQIVSSEPIDEAKR
jgi:O-antigen ligase